MQISLRIRAIGWESSLALQNTPIKYNGTFNSCKNEKVSDEKMQSFLLFLLETEIVGTR